MDTFLCEVLNYGGTCTASDTSVTGRGFARMYTLLLLPSPVLRARICAIMRDSGLYDPSRRFRKYVRWKNKPIGFYAHGRCGSTCALKSLLPLC